MKLQNSCIVPRRVHGELGLSDGRGRLRQVRPRRRRSNLDGEECYRGTLRAKVGPMSITLAGTVTVQEREAESGRARFLVEASDRRVGGGVKTDMLMQLTARSPTETELTIETDTTFMGRLGELGQPVIRRKAQSTIEEFARNLSRELAGRVE